MDQGDQNPGDENFSTLNVEGPPRGNYPPPPIHSGDPNIPRYHVNVSHPTHSDNPSPDHKHQNHIQHDRLPGPIQITHTDKYSEKDDPPLVDVKVTNPVTYLKKWLDKLLKNQDIDIRLRIKPFATIGLGLAFLAVSGTSFSIGRYLFPNSSPIFHREVIYQGSVQKTDQGIYLALPNSDLYTLKLKEKSIVNFNTLQEGQALVKGNLTVQPFVIEVSEIIPLEDSQVSLNPQASFVIADSLDLDTAPESELPKLYSEIRWETATKKALLFTSGKRRITQEGLYLESLELKSFPEEFINYYTQALQSTGFAQTLSSQTPDGVQYSFEKSGLFFTFGVKNIYLGSGDKKQLSGYKAYLEHN